MHRKVLPRFRRVVANAFADKVSRLKRVGRSTMAVETLDQNQRQSSQYIDFWNSVLVPKFIRWKHILVDGLTLHSEAIFPTLAVKPGDKVVDAGCGFGDTAIKLAQLVGPSGSILAVDCCDAFLDFGRKDVAKAGVTNITFFARLPRSKPTLCERSVRAICDRR